MSKTRDILSSPRVEEIKRTKRNATIRISILFFILFVASILGLSFLSNYKKMTINNVVVSGTRIINEDEIKDFVEQGMSGKYIFLFNKKNAFIYPHDHIYNGLLDKFPRIEKLDISINNVNTLEIKIKERLGSYMWCGEKVPDLMANQGDHCYFVNDDGYIFDSAPYVSGNLYFKYYLPLPDLNNVLGSVLMDSVLFQDMVRLVDTIKESGLDPVMLSSDEDSWFIYLDHKTGSTSPYIVFRKDVALEKIGEDIKISMSQKEFKSEINGKYDTLLYIDMRFNNKVFYKFQ